MSKPTDDRLLVGDRESYIVTCVDGWRDADGLEYAPRTIYRRPGIRHAVAVARVPHMRPRLALLVLAIVIAGIALNVWLAARTLPLDLR